MILESQKINRPLFCSAIYSFTCLLLLLTSRMPLYAAQELQDFNQSVLTQALLDAGLTWERNSLFHPLEEPSLDTIHSTHSSFNSLAKHLITRNSRRYISLDDSVGHLDVGGILAMEGFYQSGNAKKFNGLALAPEWFGWAQLGEHWTADMYVRGTTDEGVLPHFTGVARSVARGGFHAAEYDRAAISYRNKWAFVEFGRSREIWGPFADDNLVMSGSAPAWERLVLQATYKRFSFRHTIGFLETIQPEVSSPPIYRYLVARAIEYRNRKNLVLGLTETVILAGENRPLDLAYLNPLGVEMETELNKRGNYLFSSRANSVWAFHGDWLALPNLRLAGTFALDELQLDDAAYDSGRGDFTSYLLYTAWTPLRTPIGLTVYGEAYHGATYSFKHNYAYTAFVSRGQPLFFSEGNDAERYRVGLRLVPPAWGMLEFDWVARRWGDNNLLLDPYGLNPRNVKDLPFPSGVVRSNQSIATRLYLFPYRWLQAGFDGTFDLNHSGPNSSKERWTVWTRFSYPL